MKRPIVFHPILFALYFILAVTATDSTVIFYLQAARSLIILPIITLIVFLLVYLFVKDWHRAGFLVTLSIFIILYYGHIYRYLKGKMFLGLVIDNQILLFSLWTLFFLFLGSNFIWKRVTRPHIISNFLNIVSIIAIIYPTWITIRISYQIHEEPLTGWKRSNTLESPPILSGSYKPDIYYIILDGYAREDVLNDLYNFDNSELIDFLSSKGFIILKNSHSNYIRTPMSLAASLNMEYINYLEEVGKDSANWLPLKYLIDNNNVRKSLSKYGYEFISLSSGYFYTEVRNADSYLSPYNANLNDFEQLLLTTTALEIPVEYGVINLPAFSYLTHRRRILYEFDQLGNLSHTETPKFIFAHIFTPHPPFTFDQNGNVIEPHRPFTTSDGNNFNGTISEYRKGYIAQLSYVNKRLMELIDQMMTKDTDESIIIIQADHGPGSLLDFNSSENTCFKERFSILNALYLPHHNEYIEQFSSPVNTFRYIFNTYFNTSLPILEDKAYFSTELKPYQFIDITQELDRPCISR